MSALSAWINVFSGGVFDVLLTIYNPITLLIDNYSILYQYLLITFSNMSLVIGSWLIYHYGIVPFYEIISKTNHALFTLFHSLWLLPIVIYCQTSAPVKYQALADLVLAHLKTAKKSDETLKLEKYIAHTSYGLFAWICVFLQVQILTSILPILLRMLTGAVPSLLLNSLVFLSELVGNILSCALYAWYCFDYRWVAEGKDPDMRFTIIENHWPYFVGFGFPFVMLNKLTTYFPGYATFMLYFPLAIMIATVSKYDYYSGMQTQSIPPLRLFQPTQYIAKSVMQFLDKRKDEKLKKEGLKKQE